MDDDLIEQTLLVIKECFVYKVPLRTTSAGYRAADWDVSSFIWSGKLVVQSVGDLCSVVLQDPNTGETFATCPVKDGTVESVVDSSRYFVLKIEDGRGHHAFIGLGFTERSEAFDFNAALSDHKKYVKQRKEAEVASQKLASMPHKDYSLKEGQQIVVNIKTKKNPEQPSSTFTSASSSSSFGLGGGLLPPPPGGKRQPQQQQQQYQHQQPQQVKPTQNDIWGDFTSGNNNSGWSGF